jgi:hypothetical protein
MNVPLLSYLDWLVVLPWAGDKIGLIGLALTTFGFAITIYRVNAAKSSAEIAKSAVEDLQLSMSRLNSITDITEIVNRLEQLKVHHRDSKWYLVPDVCSNLRRQLVFLNTDNISLDDDQKSLIQNSIVMLRSVENFVEKYLDNSIEENFVSSSKLNRQVSKCVDDLSEITQQLKIRRN